MPSLRCEAASAQHRGMEGTSLLTHITCGSRLAARGTINVWTTYGIEDRAAKQSLNLPMCLHKS